MTIGEALAEPMKVHEICPDKEVQKRVAQLITDVGLNPNVANRYPHEFSGGAAPENLYSAGARK